MKQILLLTAFVLHILSGFSQIPDGYYDSADGLTGDALKSALHEIIDDHNAGSYDLLWTILPESDEDPNNTNNFILLYTGRSIPKTSSYPDYNREHVWAKSHGDFGTTAPAGTDAHHLRPTDVSVNSDRGNKDFDNGGTQHPEATECYWDSDSWEPRDAVKGDVARMMFYMATRYEGDVSGEPDLELVDYITGSTTSPIFGVLSTLLDWHYNDPVDDIDRHRNEVVYSYQNNRNPFIDHPEYVAQIWGGTGVFISEIEHLPANPTSSDVVTVTATISSSGGTITSADLKWGTSTGSYLNTVTMSSLKGSYTGDIPTQTDGTTVYYIVEASDDNAQAATSSEYSYTIDDNPPSTLLNEDFSTCPASGWIIYNSAGSENWECGTQYMQVNAYGSDVACNDWLISPAQNLDSYENEALTFQSWTKYADTFYPPVELKYSTDYSGSGDPSLATWNELTATFAAENTETWTGSGTIDISTISGAEVYFAFHYTSSGIGAGTSAQWEIDDVIITGNTVTNEAPEITGISMSPTNPDEGEAVTISATITDSDGTISSAQIKWGTSTGSYPNTASMTNAGDEYSGIVPSQIGGTTVYYIIEAIDNETKSVESEEISFYFNSLPEILEISKLPESPTEGEAVTISATITDADGTISSAEMKWGTSSGSYPNTVSMTNTGDEYSGVIPSQSGGTIVYYVIEATDDDNGSTRSEEKEFSFNTIGNSAPQITEVVFTPTVPESDEEVLVTATITDSDGTIEIAQIKWGISSGNYTNSTNLTKSSGDNYFASIPEKDEGVEIYFMIYVVDEDGGSAQSTEQNYTVNFVPEINDLGFSPTPPASSESVKVTATITDSDGTVEVAQIKWGTFSGAYDHSINMNNTLDSYSGDIPVQADKTTVFFVVYAEDNNGATIQSSEQTYTVDDSNVLPDITNIVIDPATPESTEDVRVTATITDSDGKINAALVKWGTSTGSYTNSISMTASEDSYSCTIPQQADRTQVFFVVEAEDDEAGVTTTDELTYTVDDPNVLPEITNIVIDPAIPESTEDVRITATITDSDGVINTASVKWGTSTGSYTNSISMTASEDSYSCTIPQQADGTQVFFVIEAEDNEAGLTSSSEKSYTVEDPVNESPAISEVSLEPTNATPNDNVIISCAANDPDGSIASVLLKWKLESTTFTDITMNLSGGRYYGQIPKQSVGETVYFTLVAEDNEGLQGTYEDSYVISASSGLIDVTENNIRVYPNPAKEFVTIQIEHYNGPLKLTIYNIIGSQTYKEVVDFNNQCKISLEDLESGLYFISFVFDKTLITKKVLVKK